MLEIAWNIEEKKKGKKTPEHWTFTVVERVDLKPTPLLNTSRKMTDEVLALPFTSEIDIGHRSRQGGG